MALFSANSRLLMSFSLALYLFICSPMISSTHLQKKKEHTQCSRKNGTQVSTVLVMKVVRMQWMAADWWDTYAVVLLMSCTLCSGSMVSGQRRMQGAKTMASALADMRLVSSCSTILDTNKSMPTTSANQINTDWKRGRP